MYFLFSPLGGTCPTPVELCEGQSCPPDMQCVRSGPAAPSVCQCLPERLDECAGTILFLSCASALGLFFCMDDCVLHKINNAAFDSNPVSLFFCEYVGQTSLSFSGNSYIKYRVTDSGQSGEMRLSLRIRTLQRRGVIMYTRVNPCTMLKVNIFTLHVLCKSRAVQNAEKNILLPSFC